MSTALPGRVDRRTVVATVIGNFVELFDWFTFGLYVSLFAGQFFPAEDPVSSLLGAFAVFAAGMLFRPLGGVLLGLFADRRGRKPALMLSIGLMGGGSVLIAITPTYHQIGVLAPVLLLIARAAQGISSGGEWASAVTYLVELAPERRKCFYGSLFGMSAASGALFAALLGGALSALLSRSAMVAWGWRLPFLIGGLLAIGLIGLRTKLTESQVFQREVRGNRARGSLRTVFGKHWRSLLLAVAFASGMTMLGATWQTVVPAAGQRASSAGQMFWIIVIVTAFCAAIQVPLGMLADLTGVRPFLIVYGVAFAVLGPLGYLTLSGGFARLLLSYGVGVLFMTLIIAVLPKVMTSAYPPEIRTVGIGLPHATMTAIFGGFSPWLATFLGRHGQSAWYIAIVVVTVLLTMTAGLILTRRFLTPATTSAPGTQEPPAQLPEAA